MKKFTEVCKQIFGYGIMITLFAGGLTFFGYLAALFIGGETATTICVFIYKQIVPVMIYVTTCFVLFGILCMYLGGEVALVPDKKTAKESKKER